MADRTSAALFGKILNLLAEDPNDDHKEIARKLMNESGDFDFSFYQMDADEALVTLGLAEMNEGEIKYLID